MAQTASVSTRAMARILRADTGLTYSVGAIAAQQNMDLSPMLATPVIRQNVAADIAEKAGVKYPVLYVYCERVVNSLREKFRTFSGEAELVVEARVSHDRVEEIEKRLHLYVDAITDVLDRNRGEWGPGMFYSGGYEVHFGPVKHGGKNFLQVAKVKFKVNMSVD
jgi:hypothetical protein